MFDIIFYSDGKRYLLSCDLLLGENYYCDEFGSQFGVFIQANCNVEFINFRFLVGDSIFSYIYSCKYKKFVRQPFFEHLITEI